MANLKLTPEEKLILSAMMNDEDISRHNLSWHQQKDILVKGVNLAVDLEEWLMLDTIFDKITKL